MVGHCKRTWNGMKVVFVLAEKGSTRKVDFSVLYLISSVHFSEEPASLIKAHVLKQNEQQCFTQSDPQYYRKEGGHVRNSVI